MSKSTIQNMRKLRALLMTLAVVVVTNVAISLAFSSDKAGIGMNPVGTPRPKAGIGMNPVGTPRPKAGIGMNPVGTPRPKAGIGMNPVGTPRP